MSFKRPLAITTAFIFSALVYGQNYERRDRIKYSEVIPAGALIPIRTDRTIDVRMPSDGRVFRGTVADDVVSPAGNLLIPRGANAELLVQNTGRNEGTVDLESIVFDGRRYMVDADKYELSRRRGVGDNSRTAKYVGGGAVFGTIIGAIAGGGKGAAIGALAGGAAGAGAQTLNRGGEVRIPAESVITFRLDEPLRIAVDPYVRDNGFDRDGVHYHDDYYRRRPDR
jgi:hypothetical protein